MTSKHKGSPETLAKARLELQELSRCTTPCGARLHPGAARGGARHEAVRHQPDRAPDRSLPLDAHSYVEALGGRLHLRASFDDVEIPIRSLEALAEA